MKKRLIVGITGATGAIYGVELLRSLRERGDCEAHLVLSEAGALNMWHELKMRPKELESLAVCIYNPKNVGAAIASGSFLTEGMVIAPCSMRTLAAVAHAQSDNLVSRAADVVLKERRRLVLLTRETPLNLAHLRNMTAVSEMGGIVFPPVPAFYAMPTGIDDMVAHTVARVLDLFGLHSPSLARWQGMKCGVVRPSAGAGEDDGGSAPSSGAVAEAVEPEAGASRHTNGSFSEPRRRR
jgi:polyprenyl P-hydroxybenzoate/phenylacrylic acid decarboxylase-like protein